MLRVKEKSDEGRPDYNRIDATEADWSQAPDFKWPVADLALAQEICPIKSRKSGMIFSFIKGACHRRESTALHDGCRCLVGGSHQRAAAHGGRHYAIASSQRLSVEVTQGEKAAGSSKA